MPNVCQSAQQIVVELEAGDLVERGEWLVHQQQLRLGDQRAGDRDAHLHAAGQFARIGAARTRRSPTRSSAASTRVAPPVASSAVEIERQQHVVERRSPTASASAPGRRSRSARARPESQPAAGHSTAPAVGSLNPAMMRSAVDLPQPDGPSSARNSPARTSSSSLASARVPVGNVLPTPRSATRGVARELRRRRHRRRYCFGRRSSPTFLLTNFSV